MIEMLLNANDPEFQTPMMQQYMELKNQYPDCLLFFRLGDFYELFLEDAKIGSHVLGITLTRRSRGKDGAIPMCGVPFHSVDMYIPRLVEAGYKIAIAEQITSPKDTPNLVIRKVIRIITPGTILDGRAVNEKESRYVCAVLIEKKKIYLSFADIATGSFQVLVSDKDKLVDDIHQFSPKEVILSPEQYNSPPQLGLLSGINELNISSFLDWNIWQGRAEEALLDHFNVASLRGFGLTDQSEINVAGVLLGYLSYTQQGNIAHLTSLQKIQTSDFLYLDATTAESLELFHSTMERSSEGSLLSVIDNTQTTLGSRCLKHWLMQPLAALQPIQKRLQDVELLCRSQIVLEDVRKELGNIVDIERLLAKLSVGIGNARDLISLRDSLDSSEKVFQLLENPLKKDRPLGEKDWQAFDLEPVLGKGSSVTSVIESTILDDPKGITNEGGMIRSGVDSQMDELKKIFTDTTGWLAEFEQIERERTGIATLKVGENSVFGFYIEISKAHSSLVQETFQYERKQTLVNAERYITPELKAKEQVALTARESLFQLEYELFCKVVKDVLSYTEVVQKIAQTIGVIDVLCSHATLALTKNYVKPIITTDRILSIKNGRHPVVEHFLGTSFVPNSTDLTHQHRGMLITGPNMAGKSTYIRQVALIVLLAHIGSFVPAEHALIPVCDRIFSRIGASDALHKGLSTFMVEMTETARILHHLTDKSLVIFDEIGRGTGTVDGMSIAQAIAEHVATVPTHPFVFFATHYHELAELSKQYPSLKNYAMAVTVHKGSIVFLRTLVEGSASESFGVEVAKQAGIPLNVIKRAEQIKRELSVPFSRENIRGSLSQSEVVAVNLMNIDLENLTPKQAWKQLEEMQQLLRASHPESK